MADLGIKTEADELKMFFYGSRQRQEFLIIKGNLTWMKFLNTMAIQMSKEQQFY